MSIKLSKQRLLLVLIIFFTVVVAALIAGTVFFVNNNNLGSKKSNASACTCHFTPGSTCYATCADGTTASGTYSCDQNDPNPGADGSCHDSCSASSNCRTQTGGSGTGGSTRPAQCGSWTSGIITVGSGSTLKLINCNDPATTSSATVVSCTLLQFKCDNRDGSGGGSCAQNRTSTSTTVSVPVGGSNTISNTCSPGSCGSCQADVDCGRDVAGNASTVGVFNQASVSCTTNQPQPTPTPTLRPTNTPVPTVVLQATPTPTSGLGGGVTPTPTSTATPTPTNHPTNTPTPTGTLPNTGIVDDSFGIFAVGMTFILASALAYKTNIFSKRKR